MHAKERGALPAAARQMFMNRTTYVDTGQENGTPSSVTSLASKRIFGTAKLVGITLNPDQVAGCVLSYNICDTVSLAMDSMFDNEEDGEMRGPCVQHKEEGLRRRRLDSDEQSKDKRRAQAAHAPLRSCCDFSDEHYERYVTLVAAM